jgi:hypothetical protein
MLVAEYRDDKIAQLRRIADLSSLIARLGGKVG